MARLGGCLSNNFCQVVLEGRHSWPNLFNKLGFVADVTLNDSLIGPRRWMFNEGILVAR